MFRYDRSQDLIDPFSMKACLTAYAGGVIDNDAGNGERKDEEWAIPTLVETDGGGDGSHERRVR